MGIALNNFYLAEASLEIGEVLMGRPADAATGRFQFLAAGECAPERKGAAEKIEVGVCRGFMVGCANLPANKGDSRGLTLLTTWRGSPASRFVSGLDSLKFFGAPPLAQLLELRFEGRSR
jgi:hypothetical protein